MFVIAGTGAAAGSTSGVTSRHTVATTMMLRTTAPTGTRRAYPWDSVSVLDSDLVDGGIAVAGNLRPPDIAYFNNVRFQDQIGGVTLFQSGGEPGKAIPIRGG